MVARSRPSPRGPKLRGTQDSSDETSPFVHEPAKPPRPKRARISSISDSPRHNKKFKKHNGDALPQFKFPLRSKQNHDAPKSQAKSPVSTKPLPLPHHPRISNKAKSNKIPQKSPKDYASQQGITAIPHDNVSTQTYLAVPQQLETRKLRSQESGSRLGKSELSSFFPNYEQLLSLEPAKPDILTPRTRITVVEDVPENTPTPLTTKSDPFCANKPLYNAVVVDLTPSNSATRRQTQDPLPAEIYQKAHKRSTRNEKQSKNHERDRAAHEKSQLDRHLEELRGPDWLKVMGISGITDSEKKLYEPKRAYFIKEVSNMIDKYKNWKEEEKRRKIEKEQALLEELEAAAGEADDEVEEEVEQPKPRGRARATTKIQTVNNYDGSAEYSSHEVDALAARQLHQEASFDAGRHPKVQSGSETASMPPPPLPPPPPAVHKPFTSFYSKRHLRDAAVSGHRRSRSITAFGLPLPELEDRDFELPESILTQDAVKAQARAKRASRRTTSTDA